jgi:lipid II:glycine glycyltransferase (peptidoglycan interpeptide bridge formation enzyme)
MVDIRQTSQYARYLGKIGWHVERRAETNYFIKKIPLLGSIIKIQRPEKIRVDEIKKLAKKYRAFQIIVEPAKESDVKILKSFGFKQSKSPYLPTKTLLLDLTKPEKELLREMKKDARYGIKKTETLKTREIKNLEKFREGWKKSVGLKRYVPPLYNLLALKNSFKEKCLFLTTQDFSAGAIFLIGDRLAYYWQAFTNKQGRKALAQYKIVWEGLLWAKGKRVKAFDFEGIFDERFANKSWKGFTHFKKSFGGLVISYPGTYSRNLLLFGL